jgi:hypothetical protein
METMHETAMHAINKAIDQSHGKDSKSIAVNALRAVEACDDNTRRMAIDTIDRHIKNGNESRDLVNLVIALRRV